MNPFEAQVAGHQGIFTFDDSSFRGLILKKFDAREYWFYRQVQTVSPEFSHVLPEFRGVWRNKTASRLHGEPTSELVVDSTGPETSHDAGELEEVDLVVLDKHIEPYLKNGTIALPNYFIAMQDLTFGMKLPCIVDLKLGRREHDLWASEAKEKFLRFKCEHTTSGEFAIRYCGFLGYRFGPLPVPESLPEHLTVQPSPNWHQDGSLDDHSFTKAQTTDTSGSANEIEIPMYHITETKMAGRHIDVDRLREKLYNFFALAAQMPNDPHEPVWTDAPTLSQNPLLIDTLLALISKLRDPFIEQKKYVFWSSSLMVGFDLADWCTSKPVKEEPKIIAKMIDFAHVVTQEEAHQDGDPDVVDGIDHLLTVLRSLREVA